MNLKHIFLAGVMTVTASCGAQAQLLGTTLTDFGAIKAGSADGAIPPYTGGIAAMTNLPAGSPATGYHDPFAGEKPVFAITSSNMSQYVSMLTPGEQALLQRYGGEGYRLDVYPTHRSASYPAWVLENSQKNASSAQEVPDGDGASGAYGGIPFPIPKDGYQVMWNNYLAYQPAYCEQRYQNYLVDSTGAVTDLGTIKSTWAEPYYFQSETSLSNNFFRYFTVRYLTPAAEAGVTFLFQYPIDFTKRDDVTYFYSPGTRRVRLAPEFKYDTPIASYGGAVDYQEIDLFYGQMDKFDFQLLGQKEMIVPYNDYKFSNTTEAELLDPHFVNPDGVRWERHRVWIVQATLKSGERNAFSKWDFYVDEDSWRILATESYDAAGNVYKVGFSYPWQNYAQGDATAMAHTIGIYDLSKGTYDLTFVQTAGNGFWQCTTTPPNMSDFTAQAVAAQAIR